MGNGSLPASFTPLTPRMMSPLLNLPDAGVPGWTGSTVTFTPLPTRASMPVTPMVLEQCRKAAETWLAAAKANGRWKGKDKEDYKTIRILNLLLNGSQIVTLHFRKNGVYFAVEISS